MTDTVRIGSLFSGAGGLDLAVANIFGGEVVWHSEIDKAASKVLAHHWPDTPNLGDITEVNWANWKPALEVDVLCGGFPCQDVSAAGKRAGIKQGTRSGLWSVFADAIDYLRPTWVVIENVRGLLSARAHRNLEPADGAVGDGSDGPVLRAAGAVLGDLADLRYDAIWATVAAADVGAPHRRERVFILAADTSGSRQHCGQPRAPIAGGSSRGLTNGGVSIEPACTGCGHLSHRHVQRRDSTPCGECGCGDYQLQDEPGVALLPTPCVVDRLATTDMTLEQWDESRRSQKERGVGSFGPRGDSLGAAILRVEEGSERPDYSTTKARRGGDEPGYLLPTPTTQDGANCAGPSQFQRNTLPLNAEVTLLPTPISSDCHAGKRPDGRTGGDYLNTIIEILLPTPSASDSTGGGANPETREAGGHHVKLCDEALANASRWGKYAPAIARWEAIVGPAPAPTEPNKNGNPRLSAAFSEWLMGWPDGWVTDPDIGISRNDQLRIIGNGVCPQQAVHALRFLLSVAAGTHTHTHRQRADMSDLLPTPRASDPAGAHSRSSQGFRPQLGEVVRTFAPTKEGDQ